MRKILIATALLLLFFTPAEAAHLDLAWDANTEPDLAGYRVYYGTASREYGIDNSIDVGNTTTYRVDSLLEGVTYYIAVTAYDMYGNESDFSDEVYSDTDSDAMPDDWETEYFGDTSQEPEGDYDGDGLNNLGEYQLGTDPTNPDTDSDQMLDGWEVDYGFNPLDASDSDVDSDGDGLTNLEEYLGATDPTNVPPNVPPTADARPDQTVDEGATVTLDGSNSFDPDDGIHRYLWTQTVGTPVTLSDATGIQPTFVTPPVDSNGTHLEFLLAVIDNGKLQHTDVVSIDVKDNGIIGFPTDVLATETSTMENIGIKVESGGNIVSFMTVSPDSLPDTTNIPDDLIYGLIDMELKPDTVGGTVRVTIYLGNPAPIGYVWYKYGPNDGWYDYSDDAEFNADRDQVTLTLVDGGIGDDDGVANGVIADPSGLGSAAKSFASSGGSGCFIATVAFGSKMDRCVQILSQFRHKWLANNRPGQAFSALYDRYSPTIANFLSRHPSLRAAVRCGLIVTSGVAHLALYVHPVALSCGFIFL